MNLDELTKAHQRLVILRMLAQADGYSVNASMIQDGLTHYGLRCSRDVVLTLLAWLDEQGLVKTTQKSASVTVAELTARGADVAAGNASVPGIKRPGPGA